MTFCSQPKMSLGSVLGGETTPSCFSSTCENGAPMVLRPCFTAHVSRHLLAWELSWISKGTSRPGDRFHQSREGER